MGERETKKLFYVQKKNRGTTGKLRKIGKFLLFPFLLQFFGTKKQETRIFSHKKSRATRWRSKMKRWKGEILCVIAEDLERNLICSLFFFYSFRTEENLSKIFCEFHFLAIQNLSNLGKEQAIKITKNCLRILCLLLPRPFLLRKRKDRESHFSNYFPSERKRKFQSFIPLPLLSPFFLYNCIFGEILSNRHESKFSIMYQKTKSWTWLKNPKK